MNPTPEQEAALTAFQTGENMVIEAGAGTGKTTTLKLMAKDTNDNGVYIAYNRAIADDARKSFPKNVRCSTAHSFAFGAVGKNFKARLDERWMSGAQSASILNIKGGVKIGELAGEDVYLSEGKLANLVRATVTRFCYSNDDEISERHMPVVNGVEYGDAHWELARYIKPFAVKAWEMFFDPRGRLGWNRSHDLYLKAWALGKPQLPGDFVLYDEAQDANPATAGVVLAQKDSQLVAVGDRCQAIYGWRGAEDAMQTWPAKHHLMLSQSFRFGPAVADEANKWLTLLDAPLRLTGFEKLATTVEVLTDPDAILCRTNASVIAEAMQAQQENKRVAIVGGTADIEKFAKGVLELQQGRGTEHPDLAAFTTWNQVKEFVQEDGAPSDFKVIVNLIEKYTVEAVFRVANTAVKEDDADLVLSTAHKAKGREWGKVRIGNDFNDPTEIDPTTGESGEFNKGEGMLAYVSVTRAMKVLDRSGLAWVDKLLPPKPVVEATTDHFLDAPVAVKQGIIAKGRRKKKETA